MRIRQYPLPLPHRPDYRPELFIAAPANEAALAWMSEPQGWPQLRLGLYGPQGSGKTHLLHLFAARHGAAMRAGSQLRRLRPPPDAPALAVDDADQVPAPRALLHWLNVAAERRVPLLLAGQAPPARWNVELPDLMSRLRAIPAVGLLDPDDALLRALLARLLAERQLVVAEPVQAWLLARLPRTSAALREAAATLDVAALAAGRGITRALAAQALHLDDPAPFE